MTKAALSFGEWVKRRRRGLGLTQKELAQQVGYAVVTLRKVEADELRPSVQMAGKLAEALELASEEQAQFVGFARDEAHWDDLRLPSRTTSAPLPTAQLSGQEQPATISHEADSVLGRRKTRHNLPAPTTALVGRDEELTELAQLLADPGTRFVTILSAGGMGKTSLAIAAAEQQLEQFADGVCWVPLAPLTETKELALAIAAALGLQLQGERTPTQQVCDYLHAKHLLLVLDNFEHLLEGAPLVGELLANASQLAILVTSRQRLNLSSETVIFLDGLRFPADGAADPLSYPAVQLFLLHARRLHPGFQPDEGDMAGIVEVCRLVHGMPLGILLAAAWSRVIAPAEIAAEIGRDLDFLHTEMQDLPVRQRNLRALFLHTWNRLRPAERAVFMRLSVFRGGMTLEAARHVAGASLDALARLTDMALLRRLASGRYEVHELLRQYGAEQLARTAEEDKEQDARRQHSHYYLKLLADQEQILQGPQQSAALDTIQRDFENISVAWRWAVLQHGFDLLGPAVQPLFLYCDVRGTYRAGMILFGAAATELGAELTANTDVPQALQVLWGRITVRLGACEVLLANYGRGEQLLLDSLPQIEEAAERACALLYLGQAAAERGEMALAHARALESLEISRKYRDFAGMSQATHALQVGRSMTEAHRLGTESLALARKAGRPDLIAIRLNTLGWHTWGLGDYPLADTYWREGIALCEQLGLRGENAWPLDCLGFAAWCRGDMAAAERYIEAALGIYAEVGRQAHSGMCMAELALVLASTGRVHQAVALAQRAVAMTRQIDGGLMLIICLNNCGAVLLSAGKLEEARRTLGEAVERAWVHQVLPGLTVALYYFAELLVLESRSDEPPGARERIGFAVTLLSCVRTHEATWQVYKDKAEQMLASIGHALPTAMFSAAVAMGENQAVGQITNALLGSDLNAQRNHFQRAHAEGASMRKGDLNGALFEPLTERELVVLQLVAAGRTNREIADKLVVTLGTAKWYVSQILGKLSVQSRTKAVARGRELGLLV